MGGDGVRKKIKPKKKKEQRKMAGKKSCQEKPKEKIHAEEGSHFSIKPI